MQKWNNTIINRKYLRKQVILLIIIVVYLLSLSSVFGRYVLKKVNKYLSTSKEFYFYSDKLQTEEDEYHIKWSGTEECIIPINLYSKLNSLKKAKSDIKYKITYELLSSNATCTLSKEEGIVTADTNEDNFTVSIIPNSSIGKDEKITVKVNVQTVDDFDKILTAKFVISLKEENIVYKIEDIEGRQYFNLIISNMQKGDVTLKFNPNDVIIDNTNETLLNLNSYELLEATNYINQINFTMEPLSNITIRFFKKDIMKNYTDDENILSFEYENV